MKNDSNNSEETEKPKPKPQPSPLRLSTEEEKELFDRTVQNAIIGLCSQFEIRDAKGRLLVIFQHPELAKRKADAESRAQELREANNYKYGEGDWGVEEAYSYCEAQRRWRENHRRRCRTACPLGCSHGELDWLMRCGGA
jgi:hypothetical protein